MRGIAFGRAFRKVSDMKHSNAMRRAIGLAAAAAMIGGSITPALARDHGRHGGWYRGYGYPHHRHHRGGLDAGDVIGIAALIGAVAVIASAANKNRNDRGYPDRSYPGDGRYGDSERYREAGEDEAVSLCAAAARAEAERDREGYAEVLDVERPRARSDGWDVDGRLERRRGYQDGDGETMRFSCVVRDGRVADVRLSRDLI